MKMFLVKKRTLLLIAGIVWLIAGFNVARLGVLSYLLIEMQWFLILLSVIVFAVFGMMFLKMSKNIPGGSWVMRTKSLSGISLTLKHI